MDELNQIKLYGEDMSGTKSFPDPDFRVKDLIALLQEQDPELRLALSRDPEGNGFHALHGISLEAMTPEGGALEVEYVEDGVPEEEWPRITHVLFWPQ